MDQRFLKQPFMGFGCAGRNHHAIQILVPDNLSNLALGILGAAEKILFNINKAISFRLDSVERKLTNLHNTCYKMGRKMDNLNLSVIRALSRIKELEKTT